MHVYGNILETVGHTPIVRLAKFVTRPARGAVREGRVVQSRAAA